MEAILIVASGKNAGRKIAVRGPKFFIGRAEDCQLRPTSDLVSRHHCVIMVGVSQARQNARRASSSRDAAAEMLKRFYNRD